MAATNGRPELGPKRQSYASTFVSEISSALFSAKDHQRRPIAQDDDERVAPDTPSNLLEIARSMAGSFSKLGFQSARTLLKVQEVAMFQEDINDRDYIMEDVIQVRQAKGTNPLFRNETDSW